ncbi:GNAT family N-acetyltransferase [Candidatus Formimonas warabiya]|uniref:N-acetyltransferase domain-containing protein n=1 Tax=Formimonas warabiya TaxID=1761012 RepID=A0A3G1KRK4_FORW1|nr:GNAT family N-acetyltransferase [Candidatus Formimonas warabiya]ATW25076.1 hypothetical protein DCMF_10070 [Candidatus Formimonas warabiya]
MEKDIQFREAQPQDVPAIIELVLGVFDKYVGCGYAPEGQLTFRMYCHPNAMMSRWAEGTSFCLIAIFEQKIIGMIEVRNGNHIALLFVDDRYQRKGIAKKLVSLAVEKAQAAEMEVNSSPYALNIYGKMGFEPLDAEQVRDGIRFIPMRKIIQFRDGS